MRKTILLSAFLLFMLPVSAQQTLSLDSCRAMALRNNKQLSVSKLKQEAAMNVRKAARTHYLPKVDALGGYEYFSKEVSLLNNDQKFALNNMGTTAATGITTKATDILTGLASKGIISPQTAKQLGGVLGQLAEPLAEAGNALGQEVTDAFRTNTHNIWAGSVMVRQPIYMGGALTAANRMADISEQMAATEYEGAVQGTLYTIDENYWLVVSLKEKLKLAQSFRDLVQKLDDDVHKLINEGIATRAAGLTVDVKVNEADMALTMVEDGYSLAKMLLCQLIGLPLDSDIVLADENSESLLLSENASAYENVQPIENRSELKLLQQAIELSKEGTKLVRAAYLPHVFATGGYIVSNPNVFNGFQNKFSGMWNAGITLQIPIWNWGEGVYRVKAGKVATTIAQVEMADISEKIDLQVAQSRFKVDEAAKRLEMSIKNLANAEENLRCANVGFREGVMESTEVMAAQTAWQAAQAAKIDAEIDVKLSHVNLKKALGILK